IVLAVDPPTAVGRGGDLWPPCYARVAQARGDLGARMGAIVDAAPPGPVVFIGADAPGLRRHHLRDAFRALRGADAVFGPADDGGYWLLGLARRRAAPRLFEGVRWSSAHALADTRASLPASFRIASIAPLTDIDEERDLVHFGLMSTEQTP
ncbi:MAG: DUF2064 domain-containing protein, partial [Pseudomonadota bacterium]